VDDRAGPLVTAGSTSGFLIMRRKCRILITTISKIQVAGASHAWLPVPRGFRFCGTRCVDRIWRRRASPFDFRGGRHLVVPGLLSDRVGYDFPWKHFEGHAPARLAPLSVPLSGTVENAIEPAIETVTCRRTPVVQDHPFREFHDSRRRMWSLLASLTDKDGSVRGARRVLADSPRRCLKSYREEHACQPLPPVAAVA
jgi:hypothetical protein